MKIMKIANSKNTKTMNYFVAAFQKWYKESGYNLMEAGAIFDLSHTFISQILKKQASISVGTAELIANKIGMDLIEMLIEGRELVGDKPKHAKKPKVSDPHQEAKDAFNFILLNGGELAEELAERAIAIAKKKKGVTEVPKPSTTKVSSKSA
ncbi:hypothetical protein C4J81_00335 [Deltaproteobacteria bacterium Smac51]|nr:hypothetical protein C4J81_00255 [Deltaproteobacteria bacterium Smac51]UQZ87746.1 hypothetical protein C4J81_00335 [Deltaproteobacteria bacterium Smac51]